jgi:hypothetical protein
MKTKAAAVFLTALVLYILYYFALNVPVKFLTGLIFGFFAMLAIDLYKIFLDWLK